MAHGLNTVLRRPTPVGCKTEGKGGMGSRRIFAPHFKLQVLDSYRNDVDCKGNQRATARKYGIHRRQIQKWLQCENNLRNSVGKVKAVNIEARKCGPEMSLRSGQHRQQDDFSTDAYSQIVPEQSAMCTDVSMQSPHRYNVACFREEMRVPVKSDDEMILNTPLDYTIHSRSRSVSPTEAGTPMDLSLKRASTNETSSPLYCTLTPQTMLNPLRISSPPNFVMERESEIWDLSIKHERPSKFRDATSPTTENQVKPVKLFKPYLDDLDEEYIENKPKVAEVPVCCNGLLMPQSESDSQFYNNNNYISSDYTYSLHELQPKNAINYYYMVNKNYVCTPQHEKAPFCTAYDNIGYLQPLSPPIKQRQCYLDFKVSAIECYYQDSVGHENEHATATKFNIHQDQFPKWLKQEELYINNDSNKFMHVVR